jgi:hypothetical protein
MTVALNRNQMVYNPLYLSAYKELFVTTDQSVFDRNRLYVGVGYRLSKTVRTEIGYMNQGTNTLSRNQLYLIAVVNF